MKEETIFNQHSFNAVRFPQALALDYNALKKTFGVDATLVTDLLIYLSLNQKRDVFGNISFSLSDFAKTMDYNPSNLKRTEKTKLDIPVINNHACDGVFEYTLFRMGTQNVLFDGYYKGKYKAVFVQLLKELTILNSDKPNSKRIYELKLSDFLLETLFTEFYILNVKDYIQAGKLNNKDKRSVGTGRNLYMELIRGLHLAYNKYQKNLDPIYNTTIDHLSAICDFDMHTEPKYRKRNIIKHLEKLKTLNHLKFEYEFIGSKENSRIKYFINISYDLECLKYFEKKKETQFYNLLYSILSKKYAELYPQYNHDKEGFSKWVKNNNYNLDLKKNIFILTHYEVFNIKISEEKALKYIEEGIQSKIWE